MLPLVLVTLLCSRTAAQFSPGELSQSHSFLEGTKNCATCHEVGKEISGSQCLSCHEEIASALRSRRGFHFAASERTTCVGCHKEHLGRDAQTTPFAKESFDHAATGFLLSEKHSATPCEGCHTAKNIRDGRVLNIMRTAGRKSFLGLQQTCVNCHADRHQGSVGIECQSCHGASSWSPVRGFDHAKTEFRVGGGHLKVDCVRCHSGMKSGGGPVLFSTSPFADCTPCHASPHQEKFTRSACSSCHNPEGWARIAETKYNHDMTGFRLIGKHAAVRCEKCHSSRGSPGNLKTRKPRRSRCTDCHADGHRGEFTARFGNDCARCHNEHGFSPAAVGLAEHRQSRFPLAGAHVAVPCVRCHARPEGGTVFRFVSVSCAACHHDPHGGQFRNAAARQECEQCHTAQEWKRGAFDHMKTAFPLVGKHAVTACDRCHAPQRTLKNVPRYRGTPRDCQSCHRDVHADQFAASGVTRCASCHVPVGWASLVFNHVTQSSFRLTGAHARLACRSCHYTEETGRERVIRFKPLQARCESCHTQRRPSRG